MLVLELNHLLRRILNTLKGVLGTLIVRWALRWWCARWAAGSSVRAIGAEMHRLMRKRLGAGRVATRVRTAQLKDMRVMVCRLRCLRCWRWRLIFWRSAVTVCMSANIATAGKLRVHVLLDGRWRSRVVVGRDELGDTHDERRGCESALSDADGFATL